MFFHRGRGRGTKPFCAWILRSHDVRNLLVLVAIAAFVAVQFHFLNITTRRLKDCRVRWQTAASSSGTRSSREEGAANGEGEGGRRHEQSNHMRIVLVSMSTGRPRDDAAAEQQAVANARFAEFSGLMDVTGPNKQQYADMHGYSYVDASNLLDNSRPASWSKIPAVLSVIDQYDWVFWLDTDTLITNLKLPVEALVPPLELAGSVPDMILTMDSSGVNAGVWLIRGRGCSWCRSFLERWWGMDSFIRRGAHDTKSGDNDALKYMLAHMDSSELSAHVGLAPQCAFNSYLWRPSLRNTLRYLFNPQSMLTGLWQPGDFVMHAAGVQNKMVVLRGFLQQHGLLAPAARSVAQQQQHLHWREHHTAEEGADSDGATVAAADAGDPDRGNVGAMTAGALGRELLRMLQHSHRTVSGGKGHQGAAGEGRLLGSGEGAQGPAADSSGHQVLRVMQARRSGGGEQGWAGKTAHTQDAGGRGDVASAGRSPTWRRLRGRRAGDIGRKGLAPHA